MAKDFYIQPDAADPVLDDETVLRIVRRHAPSATGVRGVDERGGEARTYAVDDDLILKVQRPQQVRPRTSLAKERLFLSALASVPGVSVPRVLGGGVAEAGSEYTLLTRMPGTAMEATDLTGEARRSVLFDLGRMLRRIHGVPQSPMFESRLIPGDQTAAEIRWRLGGLFDDAIEAIASRPGTWSFDLAPAEVMRIAMRALPEPSTFVALHSNPGPEHVFVQAHGGTLSGIIDFGDAYFSHPALDLRRFSDPTDRGALFAGYTSETPVNDDFRRTWEIACVLTDMQAMTRAGPARDEIQADLARLVRSLS